MTHSAWWLACDMLAVYRLAILASKDLITDGLRENLRRNAYRQDGSHRPGPVASLDRIGYELLTCPWCVSIWLAADVVALTRLAPTVWQYAAMGLALSAAAGFLAER